MKNLFTGLLFAALWASASAATKFGIQSVHPLFLSNVRFFLAGALLLSIAYGIQKNKLPTTQEWKQLAIYGLLNVAIYLGCFSWAMQYASAGIGSLSTATSPLLISILSALWLRRSIRWQEALGLLLGMIGVSCAVYPLLQNSYARWEGIVILAVSMLSYAIGTIYYSSRQWNLSLIAINGWQVLFGGLWILPITLLVTNWSTNQYNTAFWGSIAWLAVVVSIGAVQLWLYLLRVDPVKASLWLFLCPIFGFIYASWLLNEPITVYTFIGTGLVILGLSIAWKKKS
ncbi:EamA family transporter [Cytophagaceae bacterium DM2B3-1]|uniref:EamA family transporter n=1 Tax=Xanthocytophaga flava TaxID=3048013 RepID=A0ABT7CK62_9BACT|nr:EamA family transporter [Xanthocytophaga flavus]MDJ1494083.1 EamA family transporter [Xanthocytophaga flavus]